MSVIGERYDHQPQEIVGSTPDEYIAKGDEYNEKTDYYNEGDVEYNKEGEEEEEENSPIEEVAAVVPKYISNSPVDLQLVLVY
jgi:hypothetical protein